jgi:hypothetical protein
VDGRGVCTCQPYAQLACYSRDIPPMFMALALGVAPPSSLSGASFPAPEPEAFTGEDWKKSGDCVEPDWSLVLRGVACDPRWDACEASDCSCSSGPTGAGLLEGIAPRALRRGVAEAEVRCERRLSGEDIVVVVYVTTKKRIAAS